MDRVFISHSLHFLFSTLFIFLSLFGSLMAHKEENLVDYKKGRLYNPSAYGTQDYDNDYYSGQIIPS